MYSESDSAAGDGVEALSLTFANSTRYWLLQSQFVSANWRMAQHPWLAGSLPAPATQASGAGVSPETLEPRQPLANTAERPYLCIEKWTQRSAAVVLLAF